MEVETPPGNTVGSLSPLQHAVLVGSLLGDGTLRRQGTRTNALFEVNQAWSCAEYVDWKYWIFRSYTLTGPRRRLGNGKRVAYRFTTRSLPVFTDYYRWFYRDRRKRVPSNLNLDRIGLAVWYMDDGSRSRSACYLNTQQFCLEEQELLRFLLAKEFGIESAINRDKHYFRLRITTEGTMKLIHLIGSFVLPCFRYKLADDPVTTDPKGEALGMTQGNTPTLAVSTEARHMEC